MYLEWKVYQMECVGGHIVGIFSVAGCSGAPAIKGPGCPIQGCSFCDIT